MHLLQLRHNDPLFLSPQMDALYHHEWALAIAAGREFIADAFFRAPLYPYFLGLLYKLFGANQMIVKSHPGAHRQRRLRPRVPPRAAPAREAPSPKPQAASPNREVQPNSSLILHRSSLRRGSPASPAL